MQFSEPTVNLDPNQHLIDLKIQFEQQSREVCGLLSTANLNLQPYSNSRLSWYSKLTLSQMRDINSRLEVMTRVYKTTLSKDAELRNSKTLMWVALKELGYQFNSDLLELIDDDDVVEVYQFSNHLQVFCNMRFYDLCSYTMEDIFCRPWHELFRREISAFTSEIMKVVIAVQKDNRKETVKMGYLGAQRVIESDSPFRYEYDLTLKYLSPLRDGTDKIVAFVAIESAEILNHESVEKNKNQLLSQYYQMADV